MTNLESLVQRWREEPQSQVLPPARKEEVIQAFQAVGQEATADVFALYGCCGGMEMMDDHYWRLWSLHEITQYKDPRSNLGVVFGDYLHESWWYRLRPVSAEVSAVYVDYGEDTGPQQVAASVEEFIESLWRDADEILERNLMGKS